MKNPPASSPEQRTETSSRHGDLTVEHARGPGALDAIAPAWRAISGGSAHFSVHFGWYRSYVEHLAARPEDVHFFTVRRAGRPIAILPLEEKRRSLRGLPLRTLVLPWHPEMAVTDVPARTGHLDGAALRGLAAALARSGLTWDALVFQGVTEGSAAFAWTRDLPRVVATPSGHRDFLRTQRPYDQISGSFSKNFRGNLRKARNRLKATPGTEVQHVVSLPELRGALDAFLQVEASGWKGASGSAIANDPARVAFYRAIVEAYGPDGGCAINVLRLGDKPIAGQFCLVAGDRLHLLKIGYDEDHASLAPGNMLLEDLLHRCGEGDVSEVDLVTDAPWHSDWKPEAEPVFEVMLFNRTVRGLLAFAALRARRALARLPAQG